MTCAGRTSRRGARPSTLSEARDKNDDNIVDRVEWILLSSRIEVRARSDSFTQDTCTCSSVCRFMSRGDRPFNLHSDPPRPGRVSWRRRTGRRRPRSARATAAGVTHSHMLAIIATISLARSGSFSLQVCRARGTITVTVNAHYAHAPGPPHMDTMHPDDPPRAHAWGADDGAHSRRGPLTQMPTSGSAAARREAGAISIFACRAASRSRAVRSMRHWMRRPRQKSTTQ